MQITYCNLFVLATFLTMALWFVLSAARARWGKKPTLLILLLMICLGITGVNLIPPKVTVVACHKKSEAFTSTASIDIVNAIDTNATALLEKCPCSRM